MTRKQKSWRIGNVIAIQIQDYFMRTGDTDKNIAEKFCVGIKTVKLITQDALIKYQHELKSTSMLK